VIIIIIIIIIMWDYIIIIIMWDKRAMIKQGAWIRGTGSHWWRGWMGKYNTTSHSGHLALEVIGLNGQEQFACQCSDLYYVHISI
jgi:hypothetical protein